MDKIRKILNEIKISNDIHIFTFFILLMIQIIIFGIFNLNVSSGITTLGFVSDVTKIILFNVIIVYFTRGLARKIVFCTMGVFSLTLLIMDIMFFSSFKNLSSIFDISSLAFMDTGYGIEIPFIVFGISILSVATCLGLIYHKHVDKFFEQKLKDKFIMYFSGVFICVLLIIVASGLVINLSMLIRPEFETMLDYLQSDYYVYDRVNNPILFTKRNGYINYHIFDFLKGVFR